MKLMSLDTAVKFQALHNAVRYLLVKTGASWTRTDVLHTPITGTLQVANKHGNSVLY
jgi:hypothetical protein